MIKTTQQNYTLPAPRARGAAYGLTRVKRFLQGKEHRAQSAVSEFPEDWYLEDRILCWLMPEFTEVAEEYYLHDGPQLRELVTREKLREIDEHLALELQSRLLSTNNSISDSELIAEYSRVKAILKRVPTLTELGRFGKYAQRLYHRRFGKYENLLEISGDTLPQRIHQRRSPAKPATQKPPSMTLCVQRLTCAYFEAQDRLGKKPGLFDIEVWNAIEFDMAISHFGSWKNFVARISNK